MVKDKKQNYQVLKDRLTEIRMQMDILKGLEEEEVPNVD